VLNVGGTAGRVTVGNDPSLMTRSPSRSSPIDTRGRSGPCSGTMTARVLLPLALLATACSQHDPKREFLDAMKGGTREFGSTRETFVDFTLYGAPSDSCANAEFVLDRRSAPDFKEWVRRYPARVCCDAAKNECRVVELGMWPL
jgi:hypothetical protein